MYHLTKSDNINISNFFHFSSVSFVNNSNKNFIFLKQNCKNVNWTFFYIKRMEHEGQQSHLWFIKKKEKI
jgi:hypothetical protein